MALGGSYGRGGATVQAGGEVGHFSGYITADAIDDAGWRFGSPSSVRRVYTDFGARGDNNTEFHVTFTGADNNFGAHLCARVDRETGPEPAIYNWTGFYLGIRHAAAYNSRSKAFEAAGELDRAAADHKKAVEIGLP